MKHHSLIDSYFEGSLTEQEQILFDQLMVDNAEFRKEVELQQELIDVIGYHERQEAKKQLQSLEDQYDKPARKRWLIAAAITLLLALVAVWYTQDQKQDTEAIFTEHFEPYRNVVFPIERNGIPAGQKARAFYAYEQGEYEEALRAFTALSPEDKDTTVVFYIANTHLALGQPQPAIELLNTNINQIDSLRDKHFWYLAMAYLKKGDPYNAILQLEGLLDLSGDTFNQNEARQILKNLQ